MYGRPCRFWQKAHHWVRSLKGMWWYRHHLEKASPCCPNSQCEVRSDLCSHCRRLQCLHPGHWYTCPLLTPLWISTKNTSWTLRRWLTVILTALLFWLVISMLMLDHQVVPGVSTHKTFMVSFYWNLWTEMTYTLHSWILAPVALVIPFSEMISCQLSTILSLMLYLLH